MAKANPKAWFPNGFVARISYRAVDKWAVRQGEFKPYFPTWEAAHNWMLGRAADRLARAKKELASAERFHQKVGAMTSPATGQSEGGE